jgi:hypothetical protein
LAWFHFIRPKICLLKRKLTKRSKNTNKQSNFIQKKHPGMLERRWPTRSTNNKEWLSFHASKAWKLTPTINKFYLSWNSSRSCMKTSNKISKTHRKETLKPVTTQNSLTLNWLISSLPKNNQKIESNSIEKDLHKKRKNNRRSK